MDLAADFEAKSPSEIMQDQAEVVLVGCGAPNRGMGWYHAVQMLEGRYACFSSYFFAFNITNANDIDCTSCPSASLDYIIEPWFLGPGSTSPGGPEFNEWAESIKSEHETTFLTSVDDLPAAEGKQRVALISGRTADNPRLLGECIAKGCKCIYLEKPGAPTVKELEEMKAEAEAAGIEVLMGYNKVRYL